jgi:hypothetical protein
MRNTMSVLAGMLIGGAFAACNEPKIQVEPEGYRQYAEEWCTEFIQLKVECGETYSNQEQEISQCVNRQDWDWTNTCGAIMWEARQCLTSHGCRFDPLHPISEETCERDEQGACIHPCQDHFRARHSYSCPVGYDENGLPYGVLG